jgi:hypothetical protein
MLKCKLARSAMRRTRINPVAVTNSCRSRLAHKLLRTPELALAPNLAVSLLQTAPPASRSRGWGQYSHRFMCPRLGNPLRMWSAEPLAPVRFGSRTRRVAAVSKRRLPAGISQIRGAFSTGGESVAGTTREGLIYFDGPLVCVSRLGAVPSLIRPLQPPERGAALLCATFRSSISAPFARSHDRGYSTCGRLSLFKPLGYC